MSNSVKQLARECGALASEQLGGGDDVNLAPSEVLAAIARAAMSKISDLLGDGEETHELRREIKRVSKSLEKLQPGIVSALKKGTKPSNDDDSSDDEEGAGEDAAAAANKKQREQQRRQQQLELDLGQYATAGAAAFNNDGKKTSKFARLMGGAKKAARHDDSEDQHTTFALSVQEEKKRDSEIEREFDAARTQRGKKGLGAK